jgi:uncharacterized protein
MLNLCHRDSRESPAPMVPGVEVEVSFDLDQMAYCLAPGHRLRLALSNSYWPFLWPSPAAGRLSVTAGTLALPVHQGSGAEWVPPPAEGATPWAHRVQRPARHARRIETDLITGIRALVVLEDGGDIENLTHGLISGETLEERWEIHPDDPLSARAHHQWEQRLSRGGWQVRTRAVATMTATATHLRMTASLTAWEGEQQVFHRDFEESVARQFV